MIAAITRRLLAITALSFVPTSMVAAQSNNNISTEKLGLAYDTAQGIATIHTADKSLLAGLVAAGVELSSASINFSDPRFERTVTPDMQTHPLIQGAGIVVYGKDTQKKINWSLEFGLLKNQPTALVAQATITNTSSEEIEVRSLDPIRVPSKPGITFDAQNTTGGLKVLTHGRMYYDPGKLLDLDSAKPIQSYWNAAIHHTASGKTIVAGFLDCPTGEGNIEVAAGESPNRFALSVQAHMHSRVTLKPGESLKSGRAMLLFADNGFDGLEAYAETMGTLRKVSLNPVINGWCSWFVYYGDVTQDEVMKNTEFVARELKPYGMEYIQIDDGFQRAFGDWEGQPAKFPEGMKTAAQKIRALGLRPGLWLAPFAVSANSPLAKEHPEWLAHTPDGNLQPIVPAHQPQAQYILDTTHPGANDWLHKLFQTVVHDWGYEFVKTDFMEWTILSTQQFHNRSMGTGAAYRAAVATQRKAIGPKTHLLDCGPGPVVTGHIDSMRVGLDRPVPENPLWDQYAGHTNSTGAAVAKRYYFHHRTWINDPDHLRLGALTINQARAAASIVALSGGTMISGDKLYALDKEKVEILKTALPSTGKGARPLDLFEREQPELFALSADLSFDSWKVLGCFNWGKVETSRSLDLKSLGLAKTDNPLVYDFWSKQLLPVTDATLQFNQPASSVQLVSIHERKNHPQVVGTDRHISMGAVELDGIKWNAESSTLSVVATGAPGMKWSIAVHVPDGYEILSANGTTPGEKKGDLLLTEIQFDNTNRKPWSLRFKR